MSIPTITADHDQGKLRDAADTLCGQNDEIPMAEQQEEEQTKAYPTEPSDGEASRVGIGMLGTEQKQQQAGHDYAGPSCSTATFIVSQTQHLSPKMAPKATNNNDSYRRAQQEQFVSLEENKSVTDASIPSALTAAFIVSQAQNLSPKMAPKATNNNDSYRRAQQEQFVSLEENEHHNFYGLDPLMELVLSEEMFSNDASNCSALDEFLSVIGHPEHHNFYGLDPLMGPLVLSKEMFSNDASNCSAFDEFLSVIGHPVLRVAEHQHLQFVPLPTNVIGFKSIEIKYVDQSVIEFLKHIRRLFDSQTTVAIETNADQNNHSWGIIWKEIWPLVSGNIRDLIRLDFGVLDRLRQFSPAILRNCPKLRMIHSFGLCPDFPADDNAGSSSCKAVAKWLLTPRGDGRPKMLHVDSIQSTTDGLKESFLAASESANFIVKFFKSFSHFVVFELKNNLTGERMTFRQIDEHTWLLVRCPIAREEDKWAAWEKEAIHWEMGRQRNFIAITFDDRNIGEGLPENQIG